MKILLVVHEFFCDGSKYHGGIATYYKTLAKVLFDNNNEVKIIVLSDYYGDIYDWETMSVHRVYEYQMDFKHYMRNVNTERN